MFSNPKSNPVNKVVSILLMGAMMMLYSCANQDETNDDEQIRTAESGYDELDRNSKSEEDIYYMLPSALQIAHIYRKSGLKYFPDISNDTRNSSLYVSETSKLQNLGVFSADLCWAALNKQTQEELTYLSAMMEISNDLGMGSVFSSGAFVDRFEANVSNEDSMIIILSELQERMDFYLQEAEMEDKSTVIFSGAWIESIYISLAAYKIEGKESALSMRIHEQVNILEGLIAKLEQVYEPDQEIKLLISDLNALHFLVSNFTMMKKADKEEQVLVADVPMTDLEIDQLAMKVEEIRKRITNN